MARFSDRRVVVIGGNAAGMTAASRIRRLDPDVEVCVLERSGYLSYSICGSAYLIDGTVSRAEDLIAFTPETARTERGLTVRTRCEAVSLSPSRRQVELRDLERGAVERLSYDSLVIATGYRPRTGGIQGADHPAVFKISRLEDAIRLRRKLDSEHPRSAVVIGGGYIGLNMAEALIQRGLTVTLLEKGEQVFQAVDREIAALVEAECRAAGLVLLPLTRAEAVEANESSPSAVIAEGRRFEADVVLVDVGIEPEVELACQAGLALGITGGIAVSPRMETSQGGVYAAGNCVEAIHEITGRPVQSALGTHAVKQGRIVGENISGMRTEFPGVLQTSVTRFFTLSVSATGLTLREAVRLGFDADAVTIQAPSRAAYFPPRERVTVLLVFERKSGRVLGAQVAGPPWTAKRVDVAAAAVSARMTLRQVAMLDMAYSPPHAPLWDPLQVAANAALRK